MPNKHQLHLAPQAEKDLEKIYEYSFISWGLEQADRYQDALYNCMELLEIHPDMGVLYRTKNNVYRTVAVNLHLIFYRREEEKLIVVRILHGSMDIDRWLE